MKTNSVELDLNQENIKNIAVDSFHNFIAITSQNNIIGNDFEISLNQNFEFPLIRIVDNEKFLIVDDSSKLKDNAFLIDFFGNVLCKFYVGIYIQEIKIVKKKIIVSYFDEGVLGKSGPNNDGVSVFDFNGNQIFGYKSKYSNNEFIDCYYMTNYGNNKIIFYGYSDFELHELNLENLTISDFDCPPDFSGASSISTKGENIIFHSSYRDKTSFFVWNLKLKTLEKIESNEKSLIGTDNGTFFKFNKKSFTLIKPLE